MEISFVSSEEPGLLKCCRRRGEITEHSLVMKMLENHLIACHPHLLVLFHYYENIKYKMIFGLISILRHHNYCEIYNGSLLENKIAIPLPHACNYTDWDNQSNIKCNCK